METEREQRSELEQKLALRGEVRRLRSDPDPDDREGLVEAAREFLDAYEADFGDEPWEDPPDRLDAAYLRLRDRLKEAESDDSD